MDKYLITVFLLNISIFSIAQDIELVIDSTVINYDSANNINDDILIHPYERHPRFPGGQDSLICFMESKIDELIANYKEEGRLVIQFTIDTIGQIRDFEINPFLNNRVQTKYNFITDEKITDDITQSFSNLPNWEPASINGKKIKCRWIQVIKFPYEFKCSQKNK